jgi:hypothetical protein
VSLDFVAFDVETANYDRGSICAAGWAVVRDSRIVDTGSFLCRPPEPVYWFNPSIAHQLHSRSEALFPANTRIRGLPVDSPFALQSRNYGKGNRDGRRHAAAMHQAQ